MFSSLIPSISPIRLSKSSLLDRFSINPVLSKNLNNGIKYQNNKKNIQLLSAYSLLSVNRTFYSISKSSYNLTFNNNSNKDIQLDSNSNNSSKWNQSHYSTRSMLLNNNNNVNRPISPHVQIYKFPLGALTSITNRFTSIGLVIGCYSMGFIALFGQCDIPILIDSIKMSVPALIPLIKTIVAFPIVYHTAAGIRHIYWDSTAKGLDNDTIEQSSKALIAATALTTLILAVISI